MLAESFLALAALLSVQASSVSPNGPIVLQHLPVAKYQPPTNQTPLRKNPDSVGVEVSAKSAAVMDAATGQVLFAKDMDTHRPIASMTKLMTAMVFLDTHPDLAKLVERTEEDDSSDGEHVFLTGEQLTQQQALDALLIGSVNEMGNMLSRVSLGRDVFVKEMNAKADALGLQQTTFVDPTGLSPQNQASVHDVALMLKAALDYPVIRDIVSRDDVTIPGHLSKNPYHIKSTNLLLGTYLNKPPYQIIGAKTGTLPEAGYCMVQDTRNQNGGEVIAVILDSDNHFARYQDIKALTTWAFNTFTWPLKQASVEQLADSK